MGTVKDWQQYAGFLLRINAECLVPCSGSLYNGAALMFRDSVADSTASA